MWHVLNRAFKAGAVSARKKETMLETAKEDAQG
jgi:hypothetical protein